jgi:hypothetical protein
MSNSQELLAVILTAGPAGLVGGWCLYRAKRYNVPLCIACVLVGAGIFALIRTS